jgi:hypothetical protein
MDPGRFDEIVRRLSHAISRRSVVGTTVGATVLSALNLAGDALARKRTRRRGAKRENDVAAGDRGDGNAREKVRRERERGADSSQEVEAEACLPNGRRCGGRRRRPCRRCCTNYAVGSKRKRCACRPDGHDCSRDSQCCAGVCDQRTCGPLS